MKRFWRFWKERSSDLARDIILALILLGLSYLFTSWLARSLMFLAAVLLYFILRAFFSADSDQDEFAGLKQTVTRMASGDLQLQGGRNHQGDGRVREFAMSLILLNSRLRQMVGKVKTLSENVGGASGQIVD